MNVPDLWQGDITIYSDFHNSIAPLIFLEIIVIIKFESHHATPLVCDWITELNKNEAKKMEKNGRLKKLNIFSQKFQALQWYLG